MKNRSSSYQINIHEWVKAHLKSSCSNLLSWDWQRSEHTFNAKKEYTRITVYYSSNLKNLLEWVQDSTWEGAKTPSYNYHFTSCDFFTLKSNRQQVSSGLQDFSPYSGWSQQCYSLDGLESSSDFHFFSTIARYGHVQNGHRMLVTCIHRKHRNLEIRKHVTTSLFRYETFLLLLS